MKKIVLLILAFFIFAGVPSISKATSNDELLQQIKMLQQKLIELEKKVENQQASIEETKKTQQEVKEASDILKNLKEHISIGGTLEVETNFTGIDNRDKSGNSSSDITLATAELDVEAKLHKYASANMVFLWEEDDTEPVDIDEGYITLGNTDYFPLYLKAGRMYVPFGNFETNFVSDPLTLELGEIQESAYLFGVAHKGIDFSVYFFNPDVNENNDSNEDIIKSWGATLSLEFGPASPGKPGSEAHESYNNHILNILPEETSLFIQLSYLNNLADTNDFKDAFDDNGWIKSVEDYVGGFHGFLMAEAYGFNFIAEYLGATEDFDKTDFAGIGKKFQPETWNFELGYTFAYCNEKEMTVALKYEGSDDAAFIDPELFMEAQYGVAISANLFSNEKWGTDVNLNIEYLHGEADDKVVKYLGESIDSKDSVTVQLQAEF
jgi:hypothetical protein